MRADLVKASIAAFPALLLYLASATGYAHWFDSGELVAAAADFGISHPPGQPFAAIVLGAANLLPIGALAFRVALICSIFGAIAVGALALALEQALGVGNVVQRSIRFPLALAAAWWIGGTEAWWLQAVRPEVYALQAALMCIALQRLLRACSSEPAPDVRPLYQAGLAFGLALSNHHFLAALALVPALWLGVGLFKSFGSRPIAWSVGFALAGALTYLYLPLRASAAPFLNLGDPSTPARFWWVVSARAFQKSISPDAVAPFGARLADVLLVTVEDLHVGFVIVSLLGVYFMLRIPGARKYGLFWLTLWLVYTLGRASIGFVRGNPDALAYFMLSYVAIGAFTAFAVGVLLSALAESVPSRPKLGPALAGALALVAAVGVTASIEGSSLASFHDTDVFDDGLRRELPPHSVVLVHNPQTIFRYWGGEAEEQNRPDVTMIPLPLLTYPRLVGRFVRREPELKPLLRSYVLDGRLDAAELQSLAAVRPVLLEMDVRVDRELLDLIVPEQLYYRVLTADTTEADETTAMRRHAELWDDLYRRLGRPIEAHTKAQLLWRHYADSLYFAGVGDTNAALRAVAAGLALNPHAAELRMLHEALKKAPPGEPLDVTSFTIQ